MTQFDPSEPIAIIGMGSVFPGSKDIPSYWNNIVNKVDSIIEVPQDRWDWRLYYDPNPSAPDKTYSKIGGFVRDFQFDPLKLRIPPPVAAQMDMVQKMAVSATAEALHDSGYDKKQYDPERTAVVLGNSMGGTKKESTDLRVYTALYQSRLLQGLAFAKLPAAVRDTILKETEQGIKSGLFTITEDSMPGELSNVISGRVANVFNFNGANFTVDAACASSLAALDQAVHGLHFHEYDMVICGGVDQMMSPPAYVKFCKIGALSPDGSRPFDANANGFVMGEGVGVCVLKRLSDALKDGDKIYALVRAIGSSSDGRGKGITAPNPKGQKLAVERAFRLLDYTPDGVGLIEAHGTSTKVGDVVEVNAVSEVFRPQAQPRSIGLGSVKSQIGHLKAAAGVASLTKAALAIYHKTLPPSINFKTPNPGIDWQNSPFYVVTEAQEWATHGKPMRAHISSFGFGGTNFHVALEEASPVTIGRWQQSLSAPAPRAQTTPEPVASLSPALGGEAFLVHDSTPDAVFHRLATIKEKVTVNEPLTSIAYEFNAQKHPGEYSICFAAESTAKLQEKIDILLKARNLDLWGKIPPTFKPKGIYLGRKKKPGKIAFLFPGQGSQYVDMLKDLREKYQIVADTFKEADEVMLPLVGRKLSDIVFTKGGETPEQLAAMEELLKQTEITQPAVLTSDIAILRLLTSFGIKPDMVCGHSLGEYGALVASGVLGFKEALLAVSARGKEMAGVHVADVGKMASVAAPVEKVESILKEVKGYVAPANKNCPSQTVIAGETKAVEAAIKKFGTHGIQAQEIRVSHAFHSKIVEPAQVPYRKFLERMPLKKPTIPILSNVTADYYPEDLAKIRDLLVSQIVSPVEFIRQIERMRQDGATLFVEVGPKRVLTAFVTSIFEGKQGVVAISSNHPKKGGIYEFNELLARLEAESVPLKLEEKDPHKTQNFYTPQYLAWIKGTPSPRRVESRSEGEALTRDTLPSPASGREKDLADRWGFYTGSVVVSGIAAGTPGSWDRVFREDNLDMILRGQNLIGKLNDQDLNRQIEKNIVRLIKSATGDHRLERIESAAEVVKLAAMAGEFDLAQEFGFKESIANAMDVTAKLAVAAGILALKDAGLPLIAQYKSTTTGSSLPNGWSLPTLLGDGTGVIFATAYPSIDSMASEVARFLADKYRRKPLREFAALVESLTSRLKDPDDRAALQLWHTTNLKSYMDRYGDQGPYEFSREFLLRIMPLGHSQLAQWIGARGPATQISAACASTTQAVALADDWIRLGRAERVIVIAGDDVTTPSLREWLLTGFLTAGAATTTGVVSEAALPFDRRRHGMILGMGAVGIVVERGDKVTERGMKPLTEILAGQYENSAFHVTRLHIDHVSQVMGRLLKKVERRWNLDRKQIASKTLFMSHETYTPARGGSASAEVEALKRTFGADVSKIVVANTKGFTGHTMGASLEDPIAIRALVSGQVPPIANYKEPDPELTGINLSRGGEYDLEYALRLGAGFGSQIAMTLMRRVLKKGENRISDPSTHQQWLRQISGQQDPQLEVQKNTLRVRDPRAGTPPSPATPVVPAYTPRMPVAMAQPSILPAATRAAAERPAPKQIISRATSVAAPALNETEVKNAVIALVSEKTGYPVEMLELDLDMEADLGIDTVKQAELFGIVRERYGIPRKENLSLKEYPTLRHVIKFVLDSAGASTATIADAPVASPQQIQEISTQLNEALDTTAPVLDNAEVQATIIKVVSEKTGYPAEMLELDLDMEADLGIDTVKQAELFGMVRERYSIPRKENLSLKDYPTLRHVIRFVLESRPSTDAPTIESPRVPVPQAAEIKESREPAVSSPQPSTRRGEGELSQPAFGRWVLSWQETPLAKPSTQNLAKDRSVLILSQKPETAKAFVKAFKNINVPCISLSHIDWKDPERAMESVRKVIGTQKIQGLLVLLGLEFETFKTPSPTDFDEEYLTYVRPLFLAAKTLRQELAKEGNWILCPTRSDVSPVAGAISGLSKALAREIEPGKAFTIDFDAKSSSDSAAASVIAELTAGDNIHEIRYQAGKRFIPRLMPHELPTATSIKLDKKSVVLITGGGQGLGAECAKSIAKQFQSQLFILGRTALDPKAKEWAALDQRGLKELKDQLWEKIKNDKSKKATPVLLEKEFSQISKAAVLYRNLEAMRSAGSEATYIPVDLADNKAVAKALKNLPKPHLVLHAAGLDESKLLADKTPQSFDGVFRAKAHSAIHLLKHIPAQPKQRWIFFSSVVARFGNLAQTDYAAANDFLCKLSPWMLRQHRQATTIDLTAISEIGMATKGSIEQFLKSQGVDFMPPTVAVSMILGEALHTTGDAEVVLAGKLGKLDAHGQISSSNAPAIPSSQKKGADLKGNLLMETTIQHDPHSRIVTSKEFSSEKDPWLQDHSISGTPYVAGVMGLELFAETLAQLSGQLPQGLSDVRFEVPIKLLRGKSVTVRTIGVNANGSGPQLHIESDFFTPQGIKLGGPRTHFKAKPIKESIPSRWEGQIPKNLKKDSFAASAEAIYSAYFHGPSFQVLAGIASLSEKEAIAVIQKPPKPLWGNTKDLIFHPMLIEAAFQACGYRDLHYSKRMTLPDSIGRVRVRTGETPKGTLFVGVRYKGADSDGKSVYDASVFDEQGALWVYLEDYRMVPIN